MKAEYKIKDCEYLLEYLIYLYIKYDLLKISCKKE